MDEIENTCISRLDWSEDDFRRMTSKRMTSKRSRPKDSTQRMAPEGLTFKIKMDRTRFRIRRVDEPKVHTRIRVDGTKFHTQRVDGTKFRTQRGDEPKVHTQNQSGWNEVPHSKGGRNEVPHSKGLNHCRNVCLRWTHLKQTGSNNIYLRI